jgi:hypothetical protein
MADDTRDKATLTMLPKTLGNFQPANDDTTTSTIPHAPTALHGSTSSIASPHVPKDSTLPKPIRKLDFHFLPIPRSRRHDPNVAMSEQFTWSILMNLVFALTAVSRYQLVPARACCGLTNQSVSVMNLYYIQVSSDHLPGCWTPQLMLLP